MKTNSVCCLLSYNSVSSGSTSSETIKTKCYTLYCIAQIPLSAIQIRADVTNLGATQAYMIKSAGVLTMFSSDKRATVSDGNTSLNDV